MADQFHIGPICPTKRHHKVTTILNTPAKFGKEKTNRQEIRWKLTITDNSHEHLTLQPGKQRRVELWRNARWERQGEQLAAGDLKVVRPNRVDWSLGSCLVVSMVVKFRCVFFWGEMNSRPPTSPTRYEKTLIFPHNSASTSCTLIGGSKETNKIWSYPTISHGFVGYFLSLRLMLQKSKGPTLRLDVTKKPL